MLLCNCVSHANNTHTINNNNHLFIIILFNIGFNGFNGFGMRVSISDYSFYINAFLPEINKESQFHFCSFKIIDYLSTMDIQYFRYGFQLYNNFAITNKVGSIWLSERFSFIYYLNGFLSLVWNIAQTKFYFQSILIYSLQKSTTKLIMNSK